MNKREIATVLLKRKINIEDIITFGCNIPRAELEKIKKGLDIPESQGIWVPGCMKEAINEYENMSEFVREAILEWVLSPSDEMDNMLGLPLAESDRGIHKGEVSMHAALNKRILFKISPSLYNQLPEKNRPDFVRLAIWNKLQRDAIDSMVGEDLT